MASSIISIKAALFIIYLTSFLQDIEPVYSEQTGVI